MISVTMLSEYQYCPRKIYYSKVLKIKLPLNQALVKGKIRHKVEEEASIRFDYIISQVKEGDYETIYKNFKTNYLKLIQRTVKLYVKLINQVGLNIVSLTNELIKTFDKIAKDNAEHIHEIILKHKVLGKDILKYIETEQTTEMFIKSEKLKLKGIIDAIEFIDEKIIPIEIKTGSMPNRGVWPSHKLQIGSYILLCEEKFDKKISYGIVKYLDHDEERQVDMNPFLKDEIFEIRDKVIEILKGNVVPERLPKINEQINRKCLHCLYKHKCYSKQELDELKKSS